MPPASSLLCLAVVASAPAASVAHAQTPRIIENPRPTWKPQEVLRLSPAPILVIGMEGDSLYEFDRVAGAARLGDHRIVVADGGSSTLRFFDASGAYLTSVGRRGGGPGEFQRLDMLSIMPGDTLVAGSLIGDVSYFTATGEYLTRRSTRNPQIGIAAAGMPITLAGLDGAGTRAVGAVPRQTARSEGSRWIDSIPVVIVNHLNVEVAKLGNLPFLAMAVSDGTPQTVWFGATAAVASAGGLFYYGYGSEYTILVFTRQGRLDHIIRRAWTPSRVTKADIDSYVTEWGKRWIRTTGAEAEAERDALRRDPYAPEVPAFSQFLADRVGRLWVREAHLADAPGSGQLNAAPLVSSSWSVFDRGGRWLGDVTMPPRFLPTDIGGDYVLGSLLDSDGVASIALYQLGTSSPD